VAFGAAATSGGHYTVTVSASDGTSPATTTSFAWTVTHTNRAPVIDPIGDQSSAERAGVNVTPRVTDPDGDHLTVTVTGLPAGLSADAGGHITGTVAPGAAATKGGHYTVTVSASDGTSPATTTSFAWTVTPAAQQPVTPPPGLTFTGRPGAATDIAVGVNGSVWVVGTNPTAGGYGIYRWNGAGWTRMPGGAVGIAVDPGGNPWVVNSAHQIYHWLGNRWVSAPGGATDISVGANGSVWIVGTNPTTGGYGIYRWNGAGWTRMPGGAVSIAVDPGGNPWVVNSAHQIYHWLGNHWGSSPGLATDAAVGANGSVWIVGTNPTTGGYGIYRWNGAGWTRMPGGAVSIAVYPSGNAWVVNSAHQIFSS
jgi:hypothetical protein